MKRFMFLCMVLIGLVCLMQGTVSNVLAATVNDTNSDNTVAEATCFNMGDTLKGNITETDALDYFRFQLGSAGCVKLNITAYMRYYGIRVYDTDGNEIWYTQYNEYNSTVGYRKDAYDLYLEKGTYYMQVNGYYSGTSGIIYTGRYEVVTSFVNSNVTNYEPDNSFATANNISLGTVIAGQISVNDGYDTYKFSLQSAGCVKLDITAYMRYYGIRVYDTNGDVVWYTQYNEYNSTVGYRKDAYNLYLEKGTYYMQINGYYNGTSGTIYVGKYTVNTSFVSSYETFEGDDNSFANARAINWKTSYIGQISINDGFDTYKFSVPKGKTVVIDITAYMAYYSINIFNSDGKKLWQTAYNGWNSNVGYRKDIHNIELSAGTYYMQVNGYYSGTSGTIYAGKYVFSLSELTQQNCNHDYSRETVSSTYLEKGYDLYTCSKCGKQEKDNYQPIKKLDRVSNAYYYQSGKGKLEIQWYTVYDASGYQIKYCKNKNMKKGVKTVTVSGQKYKKTIKKLSRKKKYYIQIRAYKKIGNKKVYGEWSPKVMMKTR